MPNKQQENHRGINIYDYKNKYRENNIRPHGVWRRKEIHVDCDWMFFMNGYSKGIGIKGYKGNNGDHGNADGKKKQTSRNDYR